MSYVTVRELGEAWSTRIEYTQGYSLIILKYMCYLRWYATFSVVDDRPEVLHLNRHVRSQLCAACADNPEAWKDLGMELMPGSEAALGTIAANSHGNVITCCSSLFKLWLQRQPNASWRQLIQALKDIGLDKLATEIKGKLEPSVTSASDHATKIIASQVPKGTAS